MSDEADRDERTEEPTEKKRQDSIEQGRVPLSRDAVAAAGFAGAWVAVMIVAPLTTPNATARLGRLLEGAHAIRLGGAEDAAALLFLTLREWGLPVLALLAPIVVGVVVAHLAQARPRLVASRIAPKWSHLSPAAGWRRLFGRDGGALALRTMVKIALALAALAFAARAAAGAVFATLARPPAALPEATLALVDMALRSVFAAALAAAVADILVSRFTWLRQLRMTRAEVKEENRQAEGDPHVRQRFRSLRLSRSRRRMAAAVPRATMVIANPTHYAVALRYVRGETAAPLVLAKGRDHLALRIRAIAEANGVPVIEDKALARSMHDQVTVDRMIPPAFYEAVAGIIHMLGRAGAGARRRA